MKLFKILCEVAFFVVIIVVVCLYLDLPVVYYSAANHEPVSCSSSETEWVQVPISDARCGDALRGRHEHEWVQ